MPRLLFLVTEDWYFIAHRLPLARAARDAGYEVVVATRMVDMRQAIEREGFAAEDLGWRRGGLNPFRLVRDVLRVAALYRRAEPDIVHHVSLKPIVVGSLAALLARKPAVLNAVTGRGYAFTARTPAARLLAGGLSALLGFLLDRPRTLALLENEEDRRLAIDRWHVRPERTAVNRGSGVDLTRFRPLPAPRNEPPVIACAARMVRTKGIADLVAAGAELRRRGIAHRILLAGPIDAENPAAIPRDVLHRWRDQEGVQWSGPVDDVRQVWQQADIAVLASHGGEGVPLSLVEAAACGRPLVATDVPGCRDIVRHGVNGYLAPVGSPRALADALERLIADPELRARMGQASVETANAGFSAEAVSAATLALYRQLLAQRGGPASR